MASKYLEAALKRGLPAFLDYDQPAQQNQQNVERVKPLPASPLVETSSLSNRYLMIGAGVVGLIVLVAVLKK